MTKRNNVQLGIPDEAVTDLTVLAAKIGRKIGKPRLTRAALAMKALYHLLSVDFNEAFAIYEAGQKKEAEYETDCPAPAPASGQVFQGRRTKGVTKPLRGKRASIPKARSHQDNPVLKIND